MPTADFFQDAVETLSQDHEGEFFLIYAQPGSMRARFSIKCSSSPAMDWLEEHIAVAIEEWRRDKGLT